MVLCCGISIQTFNSVGTCDFHPKELDSPAWGDGRVCIEAIAKQTCYLYGVNPTIRIGDFSRLSWVSIKTLRYYDEMGLFKPIEVDRSTGYRYYSANQLRRLNRILALRDLDLSLEMSLRDIPGSRRGILECLLYNEFLQIK